MAGGVPLGLVLHYLIGLALGALYGWAAVRIPAFHPTSIRRGIGLGILYTEVISLPILITPPLLLNWTVADAAQWFAFSFMMHAIWGTVLGATVAFGLGATRHQPSIRLT